MIESELPFKQGFGSSVTETSTLLSSACAKLRLETTGGEATKGFGGEEPKQVQEQVKGTSGMGIDTKTDTCLKNQQNR